jgi:hypothetical protein
MTMDLAKRLAFELFSKWDIPRPQTEEMILAEITPLLAAKDARIAELEKQVKQLCSDASETDRDIRDIATRVLPAAQVDGDSVCVPPLQEVVEAVVQQVAALRADAERYRWLRSRESSQPSALLSFWQHCVNATESDFDAAIDTGRAGSPHSP